MKSVMWMVAALAACIATRANAEGVCYDPDHGTGKNEAVVRADMAAIQAKGFSHVRTYISSLGGVDMASIVAASGLRSALGVPYPDGDYSTHITYAANAAKKYNNVDYIFVGNENLADKGSVPQSMFDAIAEVRRQAPGVKVGTVQRTAEFVHQPARMAELVQACDFVGVNIHPWFTGGLNGGNAIEQTKSQWNAVINSGIPGISGKLVLSETGWPSQGSYAGNQGTPDSAKAYYQAYKSWAGFLPDSKKFYFQFFDTPYKGQQYEKYYGIMTYDNKDKFGAAASPAATTAAPTPVPTTPAPTTPAPTTPAPTTPAPTTVEPTLNSTSASNSSSTGSSSVDSDVLKSSTSGSAETGVTGSALTDSTETETTAENEAGVLDGTSTGTKTTGTSTDSTDTTGTDTTGNADGGATDANVKTESSTGSIAGVVAVAIFGVAAVAAAFAFIWKARQKAMELDETENKSFDSRLSMTPGGACAL